jgi:hypothetical protein
VQYWLKKIPPSELNELAVKLRRNFCNFVQFQHNLFFFIKFNKQSSNWIIRTLMMDSWMQEVVGLNFFFCFFECGKTIQLKKKIKKIGSGYYAVEFFFCCSVINFEIKWY